MTISPHSNVRAALVQAAIAWLLAGCAAVPPYQPPRIPEVTGFTAGATPTATTRADGPLGNAQQVVDGTVDAQWWRALRSPALDALVEDALRASPTLAAARAALAQSRELHAAQAGSTQLPQVDLGLGAQRQQISPAAQGLPGDTREFSLYSASVGVRYRFDFGGGIDSGLQALGARADIRQHELAAARHALAANLATAAITRARLSAQIDAPDGHPARAGRTGPAGRGTHPPGPGRARRGERTHRAGRTDPRWAAPDAQTDAAGRAPAGRSGRPTAGAGRARLHAGRVQLAGSPCPSPSRQSGLVGGRTSWLPKPGCERPTPNWG